MSDIPVIRWGQAMERNDIGEFVSYHDYAMLYERIESIRSDMQRRIQIGKQQHDEIESLRAQLAEAQARLAEIERQAFHAGFRRGTEEGKHGAAPVPAARDVAQEMFPGTSDALAKLSVTKSGDSHE